MAQPVPMALQWILEALRFGSLLSAVCILGCKRAPAPTDAWIPPPAPSAVFGTSLGKSIRVRLETERGAVRCTLEPERVPNGAALFVGLSTGRAQHREPRSGRISDEPLYVHRKFFRAISGVLVQSGCPLDDGTGHPGYRIAVEPRPDDAERLRLPGALLLARYTPPPGRHDPNPPPPGRVIGSQFVVTLADMHHLAGLVTVLGRCGDLEVVSAIADERARGRFPELYRVVVEGF
jgi:peptidyl-prolyl cis-trans isomerase A (cyclophilin A)